NGQTDLQLCADYAATVYDWRHMPEVGSLSEAAETSKLSYHCGVSVEMLYSPIESTNSARRIGERLEWYFGYTPGAVFAFRSGHSDEIWYQQIREQIVAGWPVVYALGPHVAVADGYDDLARH